MHWHRLLLMVLAAFALASAPVTAHPALARPQPSPLAQSSAEEFLARGLVCAAARDFDAALADLTEAVRINPKLLEAWVARAVVYAARREYEPAIADLSEALRQDPRNERLYLARGDLYDDVGNY